MANIYDGEGNYMAQGLQGSKTCDEAIDAAHAIARDRGKTVYLADDDGNWAVHPDGSVEEGPSWMSESEE